MKNRLREIRKLRQWSQAELARVLGVSRQAINGFESGKFDPSLEMAFKIASLFQMPIEDIFTFEATPTMTTLVERVKNFLGFEFGFERFTEDAIHALNGARHQAMLTKSLKVEPEHLLAGLLADPATTSARLLQISGATLNRLTSGDFCELHKNLDFSASSKFVLELALQIVRLQGKKSIGTEHLLWGLVRLAETDKIPLNQHFHSYGINLEVLHQQLAEVV